MNNTKFFLSLILAVSVLIVQVGGVYAAPAFQDSTFISGRVGTITIETDPNTGVITVIVELVAGDLTSQTVRISQQTAEDKHLGLIALDGDGNPQINRLALGEWVEINPSMVIPEEETARHPVGNALATFFSDIADYKTIMDAHAQGVGFGVIAQALWLTMRMNGDSDIFQALIDAKQNNDYSYFETYTLPDGSFPTNWGQLRRAILEGNKIGNLGNVMSNKANVNNPSNNQNINNGQKKDKNKSNNGNGNGNGRDNQKQK